MYEGAGAIDHRILFPAFEAIDIARPGLEVNNSLNLGRWALEWEFLMTEQVERFLDALYEADRDTHRLVNQASCPGAQWAG